MDTMPELMEIYPGPVEPAPGYYCVEIADGRVVRFSLTAIDAYNAAKVPTPSTVSSFLMLRMVILEAEVRLMWISRNREVGAEIDVEKSRLVRQVEVAETAMSAIAEIAWEEFEASNGDARLAG